MEDCLSLKSDESIATSEEFDFIGDKPGVSKTPTLNFKNGDLTELTNALTEVMQEPENNNSNAITNVEHIADETKQCKDRDDIKEEFTEVDGCSSEINEKDIAESNLNAGEFNSKWFADFNIYFDAFCHHPHE